MAQHPPLIHINSTTNNTGMSSRAGLTDLNPATTGGLPPRKRGSAAAAAAATAGFAATGPENVDPHASCSGAADKHLVAGTGEAGAAVTGTGTGPSLPPGGGEAAVPPPLPPGAAAGLMAAASLRLLSATCTITSTSSSSTASDGGLEQWQEHRQQQQQQQQQQRLEQLELYLAADRGGETPAAAAPPAQQQQEQHVLAGAGPTAADAQQPLLLLVRVSVPVEHDDLEQQLQPVHAGDGSGALGDVGAAGAGGLLLQALLPRGSGRLTACCVLPSVVAGGQISLNGSSALSIDGRGPSRRGHMLAGSPVLVGCSSGRLQLLLPTVWRSVGDMRAAACGAEECCSASLPGAR